MSNILFLAGGKWQEPWVKYLRKRGDKIILVDPNSKPHCLEFVDLHIKCDVKDVNAICKIVRNNNYKIDFITSEQTDVSIIPIVKISEALEVEAHFNKKAYLFSNKGVSRNFVKSIMPELVPKYYTVSNFNDFLTVQKKVGEKLIVKPVDAQSSRGISIISGNKCTNTLLNRFEHALDHSISGEVIVEEFKSGQEITIEGMCINGKHRSLCYSKKKHFKPGIASDLQFSKDFDDPIIKKIIDKHDKLIESSGIINSLTHSEYIINYESGEFWLIEMACRGGGTLIPSHIVPAVTGINPYDFLYNALLGGKGNLVIPNPVKEMFSLLHFFNFGSGRVKSIQGLDECRKIEDVLELDLEFKSGDWLEDIIDDRSRHGFVIIVSDTKENIYKTLNLVNKNLAVFFVDSN